MVTLVKAPAPPAVSPALESLASQADALGAPPADDGTAPAPQAPPAPEPGNREHIGALLHIVREVGSKMTGTTSMQRTLADPEIETIASTLAPVFDKYGINLGGYLGSFKEEAAAALVAGPLLWEVAKGLREEFAARRRKPDQLEGQGEPAAAPAAA